MKVPTLETDPLAERSEVRVATWQPDLLPPDPNRRLSPTTAIALTVVSFLLVAFITICILAGPGGYVTWFVCIASVAAVVCLLCANLILPAKPTGPARVPFDQINDDAEYYEVVLDVVFGSAVVGTDRGKLWLEPGALCFAGNATSFALTSDLIGFDSVAFVQKPVRPFQRSLCVPLATQSGRSNWLVQLDIVQPNSIRAFRALNGGIERLSFTPYSDAIRQLPPRTLGPGAASTSKLLPSMLGDLFLVFFCILLGIGAPLITLNGFFGVFTVPIAVWLVRDPARQVLLSGRAIRDLRRLRRLSRSD